MAFVARGLVALIVAAAAARAGLATVHAAWDYPRRTSIFFTEPQMVHLARRAELGQTLYPEWRAFPHVIDVFTPGYFWVVGLVSRMGRADIEGVQTVGRATTILCSLFAAGLVAWAVRRNGRAATAAALGIALGAGVTTHFGWMARPDVAADALGFAGFLAATAPAPAALAIALLAAGILCKQTAVLFALAAAMALAWQARRKRALTILVGAAFGAAAILGLVFVSGERRVFADVFFEASSPRNWHQWRTVALKLLANSGDVVLLSVFGASRWSWALLHGDADARRTARRWLSLFVAGVLGSGLSAKVGSDLNYYLPLRFVAAANLAELIGDLLRRPTARTLATGFVTLAALICWGLVQVTVLQQHPATDPDVQKKAAFYEREVDGFARLSASQRILTNCDDLALRIGNPFVDSFVFKMLVDTGRLDPSVLKDRLTRGEYEWVITTAGVDDPNYIASPFGMPAELAEIIAERYEKVGRGALFYYKRR